MIWLVLWIAVTAYGLAGLSLILRHGLRALWKLWPPDPEIEDGRQQMAHDEKRGYRGPAISRTMDGRNGLSISGEGSKAGDASRRS